MSQRGVSVGSTAGLSRPSVLVNAMVFCVLADSCCSTVDLHINRGRCGLRPVSTTRWRTR